MGKLLPIRTQLLISKLVLCGQIPVLESDEVNASAKYWSKSVCKDITFTFHKSCSKPLNVTQCIVMLTSYLFRQLNILSVKVSQDSLHLLCQKVQACTALLQSSLWQHSYQIPEDKRETVTEREIKRAIQYSHSHSWPRCSYGFCELVCTLFCSTFFSDFTIHSGPLFTLTGFPLILLMDFLVFHLQSSQSMTVHLLTLLKALLNTPGWKLATSTSLSIT